MFIIKNYTIQTVLPNSAVLEITTFIVYSISFQSLEMCVYIKHLCDLTKYYSLI